MLRQIITTKCHATAHGTNNHHPRLARVSTNVYNTNLTRDWKKEARLFIFVRHVGTVALSGTGRGTSRRTGERECTDRDSARLSDASLVALCA